MFHEMDVARDTEERSFIDRAISDARALGKDTAVLLVGSRALGVGGPWSDLDLWLLGNKERLEGRARAEYELTGQVFVDRGDLQAHYTFYDFRDLEERLARWTDELLWIVHVSQLLHDPVGRASDMKERFRDYPHDVLERKLRWWLCNYWQCQGRLGVAARGTAASAVMIAAECIESLCKVCCLADGRPFPYLKWLRRAAEKTTLGPLVCPAMDRAVRGVHELVAPPVGREFRELIPVKELRALKDDLKEGLRKLGWSGAWVDEPGHHVWVVFNQTCP